MCRKRWIALWAVMAVVAAGCGKTTKTGETADAAKSGSNAVDQATANGAAKGTILPAAAKLDGPAATVFEFLEAVRTGHDGRATAMLTKIAREKNKSVRPQASDTATFQVGKVEYKADDLAAVSCAWTDLNENNEKQTEEAVWMVRREPEGWRVAGVAAAVFPGELPVLLNFEDPDDMAQKQQMVREEMNRRERQAELQATGRPDPEVQPLRR
jgi:hypothetical protein